MTKEVYYEDWIPHIYGNYNKTTYEHDLLYEPCWQEGENRVHYLLHNKKGYDEYVLLLNQDREEKDYEEIEGDYFLTGTLCEDTGWLLSDKSIMMVDKFSLDMFFNPINNIPEKKIEYVTVHKENSLSLVIKVCQEYNWNMSYNSSEDSITVYTGIKDITVTGVENSMEFAKTFSKALVEVVKQVEEDSGKERLR